MRRELRSLSSILLAIALILSLSVTALAAGTGITFNSKTQISVDGGSGYTSTDLFANFKDVMPGDVRSQSVTLTNKLVGTSYIKVYLKAVPHSSSNDLIYREAYEQADGNDQAGIVGQRDETWQTTNDFLSQLSMTVTNSADNKTVYSDSPDQADGLTDWVYLGNLYYGKSLTLNVVLTIPIELSNKYANRVGEVDWIFKVEAIDGETLIQTGQMNWPIPVLGSLGVLMIFCGVVVMRKKKKNGNA